MRRAGLILIAIGAMILGVFVFTAAQETDDAIEVAISMNSLNENLADSAPQQQVVNGWTANDFLEIIARQNANLLRVQVTLLGLVALAVLWYFATPRGRQDTEAVRLMATAEKGSAMPAVTSDQAGQPETSQADNDTGHGSGRHRV